VLGVANAAVKESVEDVDWITSNIINRYNTYLNDKADKKVNVYDAANAEKLRDVVINELNAIADFVWTPGNDIDLTEADVRDRINRGWDIERVVSRRKIRGCNKLHEYNGEQLTTVELSKIAKEKYGLELSRSLIASRIRKGMSVEEAISSPLKTHKHKNN
jgi:hypothetical protein